MPLPITTVIGFDAAMNTLSRRGSVPPPTLPESVQVRNREIFGREMTAEQIVDLIVSDVERDGDAAVRRYTKLIDRRDVDSLEIPRDQWDAALGRIDSELRGALELAAARIRAFHEMQKGRSWFDASELGTYGQIIRPLERVGVYTPGGSAALPSSLLMTAIPAQVAGVSEIIVMTPPRGDEGISDVILAAAAIVGVDRVFQIGGAQAIAALAFGTESVPHVDKICGPGGIFVALAKQKVSGTVAIDQIAGPTETLVVADDSASIELVIADLIAQAEHDPLASAILVTTSQRIADEVAEELDRQLEYIPRADIASQSLEANGVVAFVDSLPEAIEIANAYAPEHMCLSVSDPWSLIPLVKNAGGIFVGEMSPEALGDYTAGPSHVMPTSGTARFSSPTNVNDFQKIISLAAGNPAAIRALGDATMRIAEAEGLGGHAASIRRRVEHLDRTP